MNATVTLTPEASDHTVRLIASLRAEKEWLKSELVEAHHHVAQLKARLALLDHGGEAA